MDSLERSHVNASDWWGPGPVPDQVSGSYLGEAQTSSCGIFPEHRQCCMPCHSKDSWWPQSTTNLPCRFSPSGPKNREWRPQFPFLMPSLECLVLCAARRRAKALRTTEDTWQIWIMASICRCNQESWDGASWIIQRYMKSNDKCPLSRGEEFTDTDGKTMWRWGQRLEWCRYKPKKPGAHRSWKRPGRKTLEGVQLCWLPDFEFLWEDTFLLC